MKNVNFFMRVSFSRLVMLMAFCTLLVGKTFSQTTLVEGDISILGFCANSGTVNGVSVNRAVSFVTWVDLLPSTVIQITDNGFHGGGLSTAVANYRNTEQTLKWTSPSNKTVKAGTVIRFNGDVTEPSIGSASITNASGSYAGTISFAPSGEQLFAFQNYGAAVGSSSAATFVGTILYGVGWKQDAPSQTWLTSGSATTALSNKPSDLSSTHAPYFTVNTTTAQYTGTRTGASTLATYKAQVNDMSNWTSAYSGVILLDTVSFIAGAAAVINTQPGNSTICAGSGTSFAVAADNAASYKWQVSTAGTSGTYTDVSSTGGIYTNFTTATLNINGAAAGMNGYAYRCVVTGTNTTTTTSNGATLTVNSPASIGTSPSSVSTCAGSGASFTVAADYATGYQWYVSTNSGASFSPVSNGGVYSGVTSATLTITGATVGMNTFRYRVVVSGLCSPSSSTSSAGILTVNVAPTISQNPSIGEEHCEGEGTSLFVTANGNVTGYQWQVDAGSGYVSLSNGVAPSGGVYSGVNNQVLQIIDLTPAMTGYAYRAIVSGSCSPNATSAAGSFTVNPLMTFYEDLDNDGYGNGSVTNTMCEPIPGFVSNFADCDDMDPNVYPGAVEICYDGIDNNCDGNVDEGCVPLTQIDVNYCGVTIEYLNTQYIPVAPVIGAEEYEFRITNGAYVATATDNLQAGKVRIIQFAGYEYGVTYQIAARAKVGGVWAPFGAECSILTTSYPHSELDPAQCYTTLPAINSTIYTSTVNGATQYRFRVINGADVQTIDRPTRTFNMAQLASYSYNTTYTIDVAVEFGGVWYPYSASCNITTPSLGSSVVLPSQCGTTLASANSTVFANPVSGATDYRFRITEGASVMTIDRSTPDFKFTMLPTYAFSTTYNVEVAFEYEGVWQPYGAMCTIATPAIATTQVQQSQCGAMLPSMSTYIYANSVSGATHYRFRFTEGSNISTIDNTTRAVNIAMLPGHKANTTYAVEVAVEVNSTWGAYGPVCNVTTPAVPTKIQSSQCGTTLSKLDKLIYADVITNGTSYRFRITNGASVQTIDRTTNSFYLTQLATYAYNSSYVIDVAVLYGGIWQPYGATCTINTPVAGSVLTSLSANSCGVTVSANNQILEADKVSLATQYEFLVENTSLAYSQSVVNNGFTFNLGQLTGIQNATTYTVKVRTRVNGVWSAYGTPCNVTSFGAMLRPMGETTATAVSSATAFDATTLPNPFEGEFSIRVSTASTEAVQVTVYDMSGKVMATEAGSVDKINALKMGEGYASGMYQVRVVQGTEVKTLKVVKQ